MAVVELGALRREFASLTDAAPRFFRAPGRVNLIGEHVDYSEGFVLPLAIDREAIVAAAPRADRLVRVRSMERDATATFDLDDAAPRPRGDWSDYARGMALALLRRTPLRGADLAVSTSVPLGAGLSSSAAFELVIGLALVAVAGVPLAPRELAHAAHEAENRFIGVRTGVMDQLASACGMRDHALLIDCRTEELTPVPLPPHAAVVVADSRVKHQLGASAYNERRAQSEDAASRLSVRTLRDVSAASFARRSGELPEPLRRRARHVVGENARVVAMALCLREGNLHEAGRLMNASHDSLRDDYEVSAPELDLLVETAQQADGVFGARMTGGGFGGSVVILAGHGAIAGLTHALESAYEKRYGRRPGVMEVHAADGASDVPNPRAAADDETRS